MKNKNNKLLILLLTIFIIISLMLGSFIVYDKVLKKEDNSVSNSDNYKKENTEDNSNKIYITKNGIRNLEIVPENLPGKYVNSDYNLDYFILYSDGTAELTYILGDSEDNGKDYFSKNELKYELIYQNNTSVILRFIPNNSEYSEYFSDLTGTINNGIFEFTPTSPSPTSNPGDTIYQKK